LAFVIGAQTIAWSAIFIFLPFLVLVANTLTRPGSEATAADLARHLEDFPYGAEPAVAQPTSAALTGKRSMEN
jgi:hypothetical protein